MEFREISNRELKFNIEFVFIYHTVKQKKKKKKKRKEKKKKIVWSELRDLD